MTAAALELSGITKSFGETPVIHGVSLRAEPGEFVVFVGPSGCGKSTLLRLIAGLEDPDAGDILLDGRRVNDVPAAERGLSMVFQSYALYPHMTVRGNLSFGLENLRVPRAEIAARVAAAAKLLQIGELLERRPGQLSGGQRQRVAIGRSIVREPKVFLFDEPLSNLDAELRLQMRVEIAALHRQLGNTMIYVTHDQVEAMTMADRIVVLRAGRIEQEGRPLDLYNRPANRFVAGFLGAPQMNFLAATTTAGGLDLAAGLHLPLDTGLPPGQSVTAGVRPEAVEVLPAGQGLAAKVVAFEQLGAITYIYGELPGGERLTVQQMSQLPLRIGQEIGAGLPAAAVHVFDGEGRAVRR